MRIAVANLTSGGLSGGYRKYLDRLMPLLGAHPRVTGLTVFLPAEAGMRLDPSVDVRTWRSEEAGRGFAHLAREIASVRPDVVFVPTARHAEFGGVPVVTMVRNMEPLTVPFAGHTWMEGLRNVARAREARRACRRARRIIAVSQHVRDFISTRWRIDPSRVGMVYHGVDPGCAVSGEAAVREAATLFTAGSIRPARGLEDVVRALAHLAAEVRLVIAGRVDRGCDAYAARLRSLARELGVDRRITWAGALAPAQMERAFRSCSAFVMTSRAEACPNTALEAMSYACPTVSVDRAPMPEFFRDAAMYYPVGDVQALAQHLRTLTSDREEQDRRGRAARQRAATFTWEDTRDGTIDQLERALS